ncbi:hypothetical protein BG004_007676 [Podila humilis]|nr:hypothetical protein BG004_007676 [Podila humilis]
MSHLKANPPYIHDEVHLIQTSSPAIIRQTWANNKEEWGKDMDDETYFAREIVLATQEFTRDNKLQVWVLVPKTFNPDNDDKDLDLSLILSAVETFHRPGIVASKQQGVRDVASISVASVFTPARYRGHGYGSHMMQLLWSQIERMKDVEFTFLYSDVGPVFYARIGWEPKCSDEMVIPTEYALSRFESKTQLALETITDSNLNDLVARDAELLRETLKTRIDAFPENSSVVLAAVTPEPTCLRWLLARSQFMAERIVKLEDNITSLGAQIRGTNSFVLWHQHLLKSQLFIVRWNLDLADGVDEADVARALIGAALAEAKKWKLAKVVIWNPERSLGDILGLDIVHRSDAIPSIGLTVSLPNQTSVEWVVNEKYSCNMISTFAPHLIDTPFTLKVLIDGVIDIFPILRDFD